MSGALRAARSVTTRALSLAVDELSGFLVRRAGHTCEVRKDMLVAVLESHRDLLEALTTVLAALDASRNASGLEPTDYPDFVAWESDAREAIARATLPSTDPAQPQNEGVS